MTGHEKSAAVIGTVFVDCKGFADGPYAPTGRNLGSIRFVHGGVGRNVAENMARMGIPTTFVSSVDDSALGREVIERLNDAGVDTRYVGRAERNGMGMWLAILDERGDLAGSISQMPDLRTMECIVAERGGEIVGESSHVLLELDLNASLSAAVLELAKLHGKPVYGLPGNMDVVLEKPELLSRLACFICNHIEAERLIGQPLMELTPERQRDILGAFAKSRSLPMIVVTMGAQGCVYWSADGEFGHQPAFPVQVKDSSGAGDAFFSGTVMGLMHGLKLQDAVVCGAKVAGWTIESPENNCRTLGRRLAEDDIVNRLLPVRFRLEWAERI